jgi:hypothetical protein
MPENPKFQKGVSEVVVREADKEEGIRKKTMLVADKPKRVRVIAPIYWGPKPGAERVYERDEIINNYTGPLSKGVKIIGDPKVEATDEDEVTEEE